ncbi:MAG TPA: OmpA family protein [Bryobacteraceae bacterium]|nr:OmpA family protein [Bryobacteraceae bacterium]
MKKLAAIGALGFLASCLFAQGLTTSQTKDDWEEINFEFNSSILSDGYPSLLRLADLLNQHKDYHVKVTGHTDYVGSARYNDRLALARANTVKAFLVKYGASADQITTAGDGKRNPAVSNRTKEGRFINRRVEMAVTDAQGRLIKEGGINDVLQALQDLAKKQEDCCNQILKRLDKLDDIMAALNDLKGENARLQSQIDDLRNQQNALHDQVNNLPKPLTAQQTTDIAHTQAMGAVDEAQKRNKKFSLLGLNVGPTYGPARTGNYTVSGRGQFFSPFGGDGTHAVQAQGEYMYYTGRQEGQFDIGLVNRWGNLQGGAFASFKYLNFKEYQNGGGLGEAAFMLDYLFSRGRIGLFGTRGFKNTAVLNNANLGPDSFLQTYAQIVDQYGASAQVGVWGDAYMEGNIGYLRRHGPGSDRPGGMIRLVQPLNQHVAFTTEVGLNETLLGTKDSGRVVFGFQFGNYIHPKEYTKITSPVPMDVPRIRYELLTRRVGNSPPVANAGPNQIGAQPGTITLDGSGSYDPEGDAITFSWSQIGGPGVALSGANTATATFTAVANQTYVFRLTVKDSGGLQSSATTTVTTGTTPQVRVLQFTATPTVVQPGQSTHLVWVVEGADTVTIQPAPGTVDARSGSSDVTPTQTTTYTLTATGAGGTVNSTVTVNVGGTGGPAEIIRFEANPVTILQGESSTLSWTTTGGTQVSINGIGNVAPNGSQVVSPTATTTYTLSVTGADGSVVTAPVTVTVTTGSIPQVVQFVASPVNIDAGQTSKLCWQVNGATSISIAPDVGSGLAPNDCANVSPSKTTTYTLTATNGAGQIQANVTINVGQVRITSFTSNPVTSDAAGAPVTLAWTTENATSVVLTGNELPAETLNPNGSIVVHPTTNSTYTLTAYGPGGQTVSVTISVFVR